MSVTFQPNNGHNDTPQGATGGEWATPWVNDPWNGPGASRAANRGPYGTVRARFSHDVEMAPTAWPGWWRRNTPFVVGTALCMFMAQVYTDTFAQGFVFSLLLTPFWVTGVFAKEFDMFDKLEVEHNVRFPLGYRLHFCRYEIKFGLSFLVAGLILLGALYT